MLGLGRVMNGIRSVEHNLTTFLANIPGFAFTFRLSPDGHASFPFASPGIEKLFGLKPEDVKDDMLPLHNMTYPEDKPYIEAAIAESARTMTPFHVESRTCRPGQPESWIETRSVPMMEADGSILWHGLIIDITERKRVEAERQHLLDILAQSTDFVGSANLDRSMRYLNRAALRMVGLPEDMDYSGMDVADFHPAWACKLLEETAFPIMMEKDYWRGESAVVHRDGHEIPVSELILLHRDAEGRPLFTSTIMTDITEQKRNEKTLKFIAQQAWTADGETFLNGLARYLSQTLTVDYVFIAKLATDPAKAETVAFYAKGEALPNMHYELKCTPCENVMDGALVCYPAHLQQLFPEDQLAVEMQVDSYAGIPLRDSTGKVIGLIAVADSEPMHNEAAITEILQMVASRASAELERERHDAALQQREREFRSLAENIPDNIARWDAEGRILFSNPTHQRSLGKPAIELIGKTHIEAFPDDRYRPVDTAIAQVVASGEPISFVRQLVPAENGETRIHDIKLIPEFDDAGKVVSVLGLGLDMTDVYRMQEAVVESEKKLHDLYALSPLGIALTDMSGRYLEFNEAFRAICGYSIDELNALDYWALTPPEYEAQEAEQLESLLNTGRYGPYEKEYRQKDGTRVHIRLTGTLIAGRGGQQYIWSIVEDITERKAAERQLARLNAALDNVNDTVHLISEDASIIYVNEEACNILGYSREKLQGLHVANINPDYQLEGWPAHWLDLKTNGTLNFESRHKTSDGRIYPVDITANYVEFEGQGYNLAICRDISERKLIQETLQRSLSALEEAQRIGHIGSWDVDMVNDVLTWSDEIFRIWEIDKTQFVANFAAFMETVHPDDREKVTLAYNKSISDQTLYEVEHRLLFPDGRVKYIQERGESYFDEDGRPVRFVGTSLDITERKRMETELNDQSNFQQTLLNAMYDVGMQLMMVENGRVIHVGNRKMAMQKLGYTNEELDAHPPLLDIIHPDDRAMVMDYHRRRLAGEAVPTTYELGLVAHNGERREFETSAAVVPGSSPLRVVTVGRDISEQVRLRKAIAAREQEFRTLVEQAPEPIFRYASDGRRIYVNAAVERITGIPASVLLGGSSSDGKVVSADSGAAVTALVKRICETGEPGEVEVENVGADGVRRYFHNRLAPDFGPDGKVRSVFSISHDITARKQAEIALMELNLHLEENARSLEEQATELKAQQEQIKQTEAWYRGIVRSAPDGMVVVDARGHISLVNENLEKMFGYAEGELVGRPMEILLPSDMREGHVAKRNGFFASGATGRPMDGVLGNLQACRKDGSVFPVDVSLSRLQDADRAGVICAAIRDITERKCMADALAAREREFRTLVENLPTYVVRLDQELHRTYVNPAFVSFVGVAEAELLGTHVGAFWRAENVSIDAYIELLTRVLWSGRQEELMLEWRNEAGWLCNHQVRVSPEFAADGEVQSLLVLGFDITERSRQQVLEAGRQRVFEIIAHGGELNEILNQVARYVESAQPGRHCHILLHDEEHNRLVSVAAPSLPVSCQSSLDGIELCEESGSCANAVLRGERIAVENLGHHACPETCQLFARENGVAASWSEPIVDVSGKTLGVVVIYLDQQIKADSQDLALLRHASYLSSIAIERKRLESQMHHQASYDSLTGLPNRRLFGHRLREDLTKAGRGGDNMALFFIDLDHFKEVNDTLGHEIGDLLLIEAAGRIRACVRESDTVARLGGDEFVVILTLVEEMSHLGRLAQSIVDAMVRPFMLGEHTAYISASIGIAGYPLDADNAESLIGCADQAMYAAKEQGRNNFSFFTAAMQQEVQARLLLANDLRDALGKNQLQVWYQPIVDIATGQVSKAEALLRWKHPVRGMVPPDKFIPVAEENGLIHEIGDWVFRQAVAVAQRWNADGQHRRQISVNLSPRQFTKGNIDTVWLEHLQQLGFDPAHIVVEITEGLLLDDRSEIMEKLVRFGASGMQVALDDFGTGYSAMAYLKKFPIDYLKIDRSFVRDLETDPSDRAIAEAIVVMARKLGLKVIAEGVETAGQRDLLAAVGCEYVQGYLYAKPMPKEEFMKYVAINAQSLEKGGKH